MNILEPEFIHKDSRRTLIQLFTADIKQVNLYHVPKDSVLGDHFHQKTTEFFFIFKGTICYNNASILNKGTTFVIYPEENHSLACMTDVTLMSFLSKPYTIEDPDIWKKES